MKSLKLVPPDSKYKASVLGAISEFQHENSTSLQWYYKIDLDFEAYVQELLGRADLKTDKLVPESVFWAINGDSFVGRISIRHELNENLKRVGGHIGYEVRPSQRNRGFATEMLKKILPVAKQLGLPRVLLTCDDNNIASIRTIEKCGGNLAKKLDLGGDKPLKRHYWIQL